MAKKTPLTRLALRFQSLLEGYKTSAAQNFGTVVRDIGTAISEWLPSLGGPQKLNEVEVERFQKLAGDLKSSIQARVGDRAAELLGRVDSVVELSGQFEANSFKAATGVSRPVPENLGEAVATKPLSANGKPLSSFVTEWVDKQATNVQDFAVRAHTNGLTVAEMVTGLRGTSKNGFKDGLLNTTRREAEAVARTTVQHVASAARMEFWNENDDLVSGYRFVATLDGRTSSQCRALDGKTFKLGEGPIPPLHINCRSTTVAELNDGLDFLDEGATRSSQDGYVDATKTYYDWLSEQPVEFQDNVLGPERGKLFRESGLTPQQFADLQLDKNFQPRTLEEMRAAAPSAFVDTDVPPEELMFAPAAGTTTGKVWEAADELRGSLGREPTRKEVIELAVSRGVNASTASTQYGAWKKDQTEPKPPTVTPTPTPPPTRSGFPNVIPQLTPKEVEAVQEYTLSDARFINETLIKSNEAALPNWAKQRVASLDTAISKSVLPTSQTVYRGLDSTDPLSKLSDKQLDDLFGQSQRYPSYLSTTKDQTYVVPYITEASGAPKTALEVLLPEGSRALDIDAISQNKGEKEVLLPRGQEYIVKGYYYKDVEYNGRVHTVRYVRVELVPNGVATPTPTPVPTPTPTPTPAPAPTVVVPAVTGTTTEKVRTISGNLLTRLGRLPTSAEVLEETRRLGLNDATARTQFARWKKEQDQAPAVKVVPRVPPVVVAPPIIEERTAPTPTTVSTAKKSAREVVERLAAFPADIQSHPTLGPQYNARPDYTTKMKLLDEYMKERADLVRESLHLSDTERAEKPTTLVLGFDTEFASSPIFKKRVQSSTEFLQNIVHKDFLPESMRVNGIPRGGRSFYVNAKGGEPARLGLAPDAQASTIVHEIAHHLEMAHPEIDRAAREFLAKRRGDDDMKPMSVLAPDRQWKSWEMSFEDKWKKNGGDPYMGKTYPGGGSELITMGVERLFKDPIGFAQKDPEYFEFLVTLLQKR